MALPEQLKKYRKKKKYTQAELSAVSGVSQQAISFIENGRNSPSATTIKLLADALGVSIVQLMEDDTNEKEPAPEQSRQDLMESIGEMFKQLPPDQQAQMIGYLRGLAAASSQKR